MKVFENIAEYQAFKRKYEMMGQLERERLLDAARNPDSLKTFWVFVDEVLTWPVDPSLKEKVREMELQADIKLRRLLNRIPR